MPTALSEFISQKQRSTDKLIDHNLYKKEAESDIDNYLKKIFKNRDTTFKESIYQKEVYVVKAKIKKIQDDNIFLIFKNKKNSLEEWKVSKQKIRIDDLNEGEIIKISLIEVNKSYSLQFRKYPKNYYSNTQFLQVDPNELDNIIKELKND